MATGLSTQLAKQVGEYLVAAELARMGLITATFAGNIPDFDIVATDRAGKSVLVQVKAVTGTSWQFDVRRFVAVQLEGQQQVIGLPVPERVPRLVCVMVALSEYGKDRFYVLQWTALRDLVVGHHRGYLNKHEGIRPKKFDSFHTAITELQLAPFKDAWLPEFRDRVGLALT